MSKRKHRPKNNPKLDPTPTPENISSCTDDLVIDFTTRLAYRERDLDHNRNLRLGSPYGKGDTPREALISLFNVLGFTEFHIDLMTNVQEAAIGIRKLPDDFQLNWLVYLLEEIEDEASKTELLRQLHTKLEQRLENGEW